ncbi:MAG: type I DNA topoisomerase [Ignavibacteria bacterium]|jgi:DNA topoisomerase-1|nr:type I DNA topoisomerase [Ignavibacteria bacterium]
MKKATIPAKDEEITPPKDKKFIPNSRKRKSANKVTAAFGKTLVVVESPAKAKTINKYLGRNYVVEASVGHIKDLSKFKMGIDIENNFEPKYITIRGKADVIKSLKELAKDADQVLIATDPDREGEAIAWHIAQSVKDVNDNIQRVVFNEITKSSILKSITQPRDIDLNMFNSQQARRVMDRIIGFKVSPFLSNALIETTTASLSAGRVQSVAMRMICEREEMIQAFEGIEYWVINADFVSQDKDILAAKLIAFDNTNIKNPEGSKKGDSDDATLLIKSNLEKLHYIRTDEQATDLIARIKKQEFSITDINKTRKARKPSSPFTTSLLQQDASRKLGFSNKKTMAVAQRLYEGVNVGEGDVGLITYMRTDSVRIAPEAIEAARQFIKETYGTDYVPEFPPTYTSKSSNMQDAHEAIRPTTITYTPDSIKQYLDKDELLLYSLIYNRFLASQMTPAILEQTAVNIVSKDPSEHFAFRANGTVIVFNGFLAVYDYQNETDEDSKSKLPKGLEANQPTTLDTIDKVRSATKPPARYNEASLVKELDELGIGRPSTYAQIVSTLLDREYVEIISKAFVPTELGVKTNSVLVDSFPDLINVDFTAKMEGDLDLIADGDMTYLSLMNDFYNPFIKSLDNAESKFKADNKGVKCELCGGDMIIKVSRRGRFLGCSNYPECTNTKSLKDIGKPDGERAEPIVAEGIFCDACGSPMLIREGKYGSFYGCSNYPECKTIKPIATPILCPKCGEGHLVERFSPKTRKKFWGCSAYPKCNNLTNNEPVNEQCPKCGNYYLEIKYKKVAGGYEKYKLCPKCAEKFEITN